jgi:hypothetical protein
MATVADADTYFTTEVFHNDLWVALDADSKQRALNNAENMLYRFFKGYNKDTKPVDDKAIYEQAYFILLIDDTIQKAPLGLKQVRVQGITIQVDKTTYPIAPDARLILYGSVRLGRTVL